MAKIRPKDASSGGKPTKAAGASNVKVDNDLLTKLKIVAVARGLDAKEYLDQIIRDRIETDYAEYIRGAAQSLPAATS